MPRAGSSPGTVNCGSNGSQQALPLSFGLEHVQGVFTAIIQTMETQLFTGHPLSRSLDVLRSFDGTSGPAGEVSLIVVEGRSVCVRSSTGDTTDLQALLIGISDPQLDLNSEHIAFVWTDEGKDQRDVST